MKKCFTLVSFVLFLFITNIKSQCLSEGFNNFNTGTRPSGWIFTNFANTSVYTTSGNYGASSPSIRFDATGDIVETSTIGGTPSTLSFWIKGQSTGASDALLVEGWNGTSWITIDNITNSIPTAATTKTYNTGLGTFTKFKFTYTKVAGNIGFDDVTVVCSSCAPTTQASALTFTSLNPLNYTVGWTNGNGTARLLIGKQGSAPTDPNQNANHSSIQNSTWTAGTNEMPPSGSTIRVLYDGTGNAVNVSALTAETQYCFNVYEYQGSHCYNLTELTGCRYTLSVEPTSHGTFSSCNAVSSSQIDLGFSAASGITNADGYIILQKIGSAPTDIPIDGTEYIAGNTIGTSSVAAVVYSTALTSQAITSLTPNTNYYFTLIPFNYDGTNSHLTYNYFTTATIPSTNCTTSCPSITIGTQPSNSTIVAGANTSFTIGSITPALSYTYQWQVNTGSGWTDLTNTAPYSNVTTTTLNITSATLAMNGYQYRCNVTYSGCTAVSSNAATLSVTSGYCLAEDFTSTTFAPTSWTQTNVTRSTTAGDYNTAPAAATFASNTGVLTTLSVANPTNMSFYLGRSSNTTAKSMYINVSTASQSGPFTTIAIYDHNNVPVSSYNQYTVNFDAYSSYPTIWIQFEKASSTTSPWRLDDIQVSCGSSCTQPSITSQPANQSGCVNTNINFTVAASGSPTYQWEMKATNATGDLWTNVANGTPSGITYTGATTGTLTVNGSATVSAYYYRCKILNGGCYIYSNTVSLAITNVPSITTQPTNQSVTTAQTATYTVAATGASTYQWQENTGSGWNNITNGGVYAGATGASFTITNPPTSMNAYQYRCIVTNSCGNVNSNAATLTVTNTAPTISSFATTCAGYTPGNTVVDLSWSASTGNTGYCVFAIAGASGPTGTLNDANTYVANSNFSAATVATPSTLGKCVYNGTGTSVSVTGLTNNTAYSFRVIPYNGNTQTGWYTGNAASSNLLNKTIDIPEVNTLAASIEDSKSTITWVNPVNAAGTKCWDQILVVANAGAVSFTPSGDGSAYTANTVYAGANQVVFKATPATTPSVLVTGLTNGTQYCFKVFVRKGTEWSDGTETCIMPGVPVTDNGCDANDYGTMTFNYPTNLIITDVNIGVKTTTTYRGDLIVKVVSPQGTEIILQNNVGTSADNLDALFDDAGSGSTATGNHTIDASYDVTCPPQGTPTQPLSTFNGELSQGVWTLKVCDAAAVDLAYINKFDVFITGTVPCTPTATISSVAPTTGPQGTIVTIKGTGFTGVTAVKFGTVNATSFTIAPTGDSIFAEVPANVPAAAKISVYDASNCPVKTTSDFTFLTSSGVCGSGQTATDLFISEVFDATTGDGSYIEVFNGTASTINLASPQYSITVIAYGNTGSSTTSLNLTGTLAPGAVYLLRTGINPTTAPCSVTPTYYNNSNNLTFNGNDEVFLKKAGVTIDYVPNPNQGAGFSQIRKETVTSPTTSYNANEWTITSTEDCSNLGISPYAAGTTINITAQPVDQSSCSMTFTVAANVSPGSITYKWRFHNGKSGATWTDVTAGAFPGLTVTGENTSTVTINGDLTAYNGYQFYCEVSSTSGSCIKYTNAVQFTVNAQRYFRSKAASVGNWTSVANWEMATSAAGPWTAACTYPTAGNSDYISIENGTDISLNIDLTLDQIIVQTGGTMRIDINSQISLNNVTGIELDIQGTYVDSANAVNKILFSAGSTWRLGASGTIVRIGQSDATDYRDFYEGGMSTIPATATWIYRYAVSGMQPNMAAINCFYPNLYFEATVAAWNPNIITAIMRGGATGYCTVKGDMFVGTTGTQSVTVYNNNYSATPMILLGDLNIGALGTLTIHSYEGTAVGASWGHGTGFNLAGNLMNNGVLDVNANNATNPLPKGILRFNGSGTQTVSGSGVFDLYNVELAKASQTLVDMQVNLTAQNNLNFANAPVGGILKTNSNVFTVANGSNTAAVTGHATPYVGTGTPTYSNDRYVWGYLERLVNSNAEYVYPVGDAVAGEGYNPLRFITSAGTGSATYATCNFIPGDPGTCIAGPTFFSCSGSNKFLKYSDMTGEGKWRMTSSSGTIFSYDVYLHPNQNNANVNPNEDANTPPYFYRNNYRTLKAPNGTTDWSSYVLDGDECTVGYYYNSPGFGYSGFSDFAIPGGSGNTTALPVELSSFTGNCNNDNTVALFWTTASELNVRNFVVQKSTDGIQFYDIASVNAVGNTNLPQNYSTLDNNFITESAYYRLLIIDNDGSTKLSTVILMNCEDNTSGVNVYAVDQQGIFVKTNMAVSSNSTVEVFDVAGKRIYNEQITLPQGYYKHHLDMETILADGVYIVRLNTGSKIYSQKVWVH